MSWIPKEELAEIKQISLIAYLEHFEPDELIKVSSKEYKMKSHDSLRLSNGMWKRFSTGDAGKSALDYLIKVEHMKLPDAVKLIESRMNGSTDRNSIINSHLSNDSKLEHTPTSLKLPPKSEDNSRVVNYLIKRGIDAEIIEFCIDNNLIYESADRHNVVFVGFDDGTPKFAEERSAHFGKRFIANVKGSKKEYSFRIVGEVTNKIHVFEGPIDLLSYMTMAKMHGANWRDHTYISLSGVNFSKEEGLAQNALAYFLSTHPEVEHIYLHLDNDEPGKACSQYLVESLEDRYLVIDAPPLTGKDCNECLVKQLKELRDDIER